MIFHYNGTGEIPENTTILHCFDARRIRSFSAPLPQGLQKLYCDNTQITSLPALPQGLRILYCSNTQITGLPELPSSVETLDCDKEIIPYNNCSQIITYRKLHNKKLKEENEKLKKYVERLEEQIRIMPGGEAYFEAMEHYNTLRNQALQS